MDAGKLENPTERRIILNLRGFFDGALSAWEAGIHPNEIKDLADFLRLSVRYPHCLGSDDEGCG